ncbi:MAG: hypothetical protein AAGA30_06305, partial [Planctomycetota bacterium]
GLVNFANVRRHSAILNQPNWIATIPMKWLFRDFVLQITRDCLDSGQNLELRRSSRETAR